MRIRITLIVLLTTVAAVATTPVRATVASRAPADHPSTTAPAYPSAWPPLRTAAAFFLRELREKTGGDWRAAWRTLYPLHQHVAPRVDFVGCERTRPFPAPLESLRVVGIRKALVHVPGLSRPVPGVAVDVHVALRWYGPRDPILLRRTFHLVPVRGRWTWLLSAGRYRLYHDGACTPGLAV